MKRQSFLTLVAAAAAVPPAVAPRAVFAADRVRAVVRLGRADRATLVGVAGGCASRRSHVSVGGYTLADFV